ncbi:flagellar basal body P-ring formation chaperone FlgA [Thiomonas sp. FB-Cd]|uniref:flagellar basal body P-ring formation chaperone FlgA n=1 Tax=Thiomonas sp. FB-Cd TaxID=1158292 RepID=UPI00068D9EA8|nr:flagellar basal body P-ring formation chaperone FlgA [Thiomonas sp. FB-Cd]
MNDPHEFDVPFRQPRLMPVPPAPLAVVRGVVIFCLVMLGLATTVIAAPRATQTGAQEWERATTIRQTVEDFVRGRLPQQAQQPRIAIQGPAAGLHFPRCTQLHAQDFGSANPFGAQTVEVRCEAPQVWSLYLPVQVSWPQGAVIADRALGAGHVLTIGDLSVVQRDLSKLPAGAVTKPEQAIGRVLQYSVAAGQSITQDMLTGRQIVHYGQSVSLVAIGPGVRLVALGMALENGREGQTIMARNVQSGKVVTGVLDSEGQVMVALGP